MDFEFDEQDETLRQEVRQFLDDELPDDWVGIFREGDAAEVALRADAGDGTTRAG